MTERYTYGYDAWGRPDGGSLRSVEMTGIAGRSRQ